MRLPTRTQATIYARRGFRSGFTGRGFNSRRLHQQPLASNSQAAVFFVLNAHRLASHCGAGEDERRPVVCCSPQFNAGFTRCVGIDLETHQTAGRHRLYRIDLKSRRLPQPQISNDQRRSKSGAGVLVHGNRTCLRRIQVSYALRALPAASNRIAIDFYNLAQSLLCRPSTFQELQPIR